jgi:hypothetical protein
LFNISGQRNAELAYASVTIVLVNWTGRIELG